MDEKGKYKLLVIGGSAGSLSMVLHILPLLRAEMYLSVIIVFHRKQATEDTLVDLLAGRTTYRVKEAEDKDELLPGVVYVAPPEYHVLVEKDRSLSLDISEKVNYSRPSIDVTFESASDAYGESLICLLLSGANADGVRGLWVAKQAGAFIVVQDPASAEFPMMPQEAVDKVPVDMLLHENNLSTLMNLFF
ncbi:MAG: chemotaxis protein CheB [Chryseolinea sp.]